MTDSFLPGQEEIEFPPKDEDDIRLNEVGNESLWDDTDDEEEDEDAG